MEEDTVRQAIHDLIARKEARIKELQDYNKTELRALSRIQNDITIEAMMHGINTLLQLEHNLRLCGCPNEAYQQGSERHTYDSATTTHDPQ